MKNNSLIMVAAMSVALFMGCASTSVASNGAGGIDKGASGSKNENNYDVQARKSVIVDWQDRTIGAKVNPEWLQSIVRGNGNLYVQMYGLSDEYANHKWFTRGAQHRALASAQTIAEAEVLQAVAQEMANTVNSSMGSNLTDGQKDAIRTICSKVNNVPLTGVGNRGSYWQLERTTDEYGNTVNVYNYYAIYSCPRDVYNRLLNVYMLSLLKSKDLPEDAGNEIKKHAQEILNDAQEQSERVELAKEREWKAQLVHEETERRLAREETLRVQSENFAEAAANASPYTSLNMKGAGNAAMDPALAALIGAM
ncbi:MAG: hypothetical protein K5829_15800 [Treponema sp.]|nr:hypothetical protein [Treponema sp.]